MGRGSTSLDNYQYDNWLAENKKERELRGRHLERKGSNKGYEGWHFGVGEKPIFAKDKEDFRKKLAEKGLLMRDDVKKGLR